MPTLYQTIKATSGLIAYWPLHDATDHSGNGKNLTVAGAPAYNQPVMTTDWIQSLQVTTTATLRIDQSTLPKIKAVEGWFRLSGAKTGGVYSPVIGINQPLTGANNRVILLYRDVDGVHSFQAISPLGGSTIYKSLTQLYDNLSVGNHHFVIQLNDAGTQTDVYIDGVKDSALTIPMDVFLQTAAHHLTVGAYISGGTVSANCQCSNYAAYNRPLTPAEIAERQTFTLGVFSESTIKKAMPPKLLAANPEVRAVFQPQDVDRYNNESITHAGPMLRGVAAEFVPILRSEDNYWIRDGVFTVKQGYIAGKVTIRGVPASRRVLCMDIDGRLVGETWSDKAGNYRFDLLWLDHRYLLVAQDNFQNHQYNPAAIDMKTPEAY